MLAPAVGNVPAAALHPVSLAGSLKDSGNVVNVYSSFRFLREKVPRKRNRDSSGRQNGSRRPQSPDNFRPELKHSKSAIALFSEVFNPLACSELRQNRGLSTEP